MDSFLEGKTLQDSIKEIKKIIYQKIHSDFLNKYCGSSGTCNRESLTTNTQNDFNDDGVPTPESSWTRIDNSSDGHCFYHSIWRFMVMTEHPQLTTFFNKKNFHHKPTVLSEPGWNKLGVLLVRNRIMKEYPELAQLEKFMHSHQMARTGQSTPYYSGDIGIENREYQLMANFLEIGIAIFTPKNNSPYKKSFWTFFCPRDNNEGACESDFRGFQNIAFIINSNGNHFETLIPTPYNEDVIGILIKDREHINPPVEGHGGQRKKNRKFSKNKRKSKQTKRKITNKNRI